MRLRLAPVSLLLLLSGTLAFGHRLDEYLQATTISIEKDRVEAQLRLTPGVAVFQHVMGMIDTDRNGVITSAEQGAYAERVLGDLSLSVDGDRLRLHLISTTFPEMDQMKEGLGEIQMTFAADVPNDQEVRKLVFENRHQRPIAAYLANCLVPRDPGIRVTGQNRNYEQSLYRLSYSQDGPQEGPLSLAWWFQGPAFVGALAGILLARLTFLWRRRQAETPMSAQPSA